jgi:predicted membrane-bound spermidine synthase
MQAPPISSGTISNARPSHAIVTATVAAVGACLALPLAFIPFLGLAGSALVLGFVIAVAIWTRRKRALIGAGVALLSALTAFISSIICLGAIIDSRNDATAKVAQVQAQLQALQARTSNGSDQQNAYTELIKTLGGKDVTDEQANIIGKLAELGIHWLNSDANTKSNPEKK